MPSQETPRPLDVLAHHCSGCPLLTSPTSVRGMRIRGIRNAFEFVDEFVRRRIDSIVVRYGREATSAALADVVRTAISICEGSANWTWGFVCDRDGIAEFSAEMDFRRRLGVVAQADRLRSVGGAIVAASIVPQKMLKGTSLENGSYRLAVLRAVAPPGEVPPLATEFDPEVLSCRTPPTDPSDPFSASVYWWDS